MTVQHSLVKALRSVPDFASLDDRTLLRIVGASMNLFYGAGSMVFETGEPSEGLYIVLSGEVRIYDEQEAEVSTAGPGQSFGELSLLLETTHTKNARAEQDTELMVIPEASFKEMLELDPDLAALFRRRLEERMPMRGTAETSEAAEES